MCEGETTPPPLLHEADLIALMEKHGIGMTALCSDGMTLFVDLSSHPLPLPLSLSGTDATPAEHIETIKARNYVGVQSDGSFVPGELGMGLVEGNTNYMYMYMYTKMMM